MATMTAIPNRGYWDDTSTWDDTLNWADSPWADEIDFDVAQVVARSAVGSLIEIEQAVEFAATGSGALINIEQLVNTTGAGSLAEVEQKVRNSNQAIVRPWELSLSIAGFEIPESQIVGNIEVTRTENESALMIVTLKPPVGLQDLNFYEGKLITLDVFKTATGKTTRVYRGRIDIPECDLLLGTITLRCSNILKEITNTAGFTYSYNGRVQTVADLGYYSADVFSEPKDQAEEVEQRLETVEASLDYAPNGRVYLADWEPKASPDFVLNSADVYRRNPSVEVASRGRVINKVKIDLQYQYQRLRHRERHYNWDMQNPITGGNWDLCDGAAWGIHPPQLELLRSAIGATGLAYKITSTQDSTSFGGISNPPTLANGVYTYSTFLNNCGAGNCTFSAYTDYFGITYSWTKGNPYVTDANWTILKRFTQNIDETVTIELTAPQSVAQYGEVLREYTHGVRSEYDPEWFESLSSYSAAPAGFTQSPNGDFIFDADNQDGAGDRWNKLFTTTIKKAVAQMRNSHRANRVKIETDLRPDIDLQHTIQLSTNRVNCKGKVYQVRHVFNISERDAHTEIELAMSKAQGTPPAGFVLSSQDVRPAASDPANTPSTINIGTKLINYGQTADPAWAGYIMEESSFARYKETVSLAKCWIHSIVGKGFIVDFPAIEDAARDDAELTKTTSEQVGIRDDLLTVTFLDN